MLIRPSTLYIRCHIWELVPRKDIRKMLSIGKSSIGLSTINFETSTMSSLSLPLIYLLMELVVEIDFIFEFFMCSIITFSRVPNLPH